jgi:hypothetical protein
MKRRAVAYDIDEPADDGVDHTVALDVVGTVEGADKSSTVKFAWDYLRHYEEVFGPFRDLPINVIEVGVAGGHSLRLWQWYFSAARIIGIDIAPSAKALAGGRVSIEIGSQADGNFLRRICQAHPPTLFIDDGSHLADHNIFTFERVFPMLLPGGIYVVEDLAFHFGPTASRWQGTTARNAPEYFLDLARCCMARRPVAGAERLPMHIVKMVDCVTFVGSAAIIRKRRTRRAADRALEYGAWYLSQRRLGAQGYERLAAYGVTHAASPRAIEGACKAAAAAGSQTVSTRCIHADALLQTGRAAEAARVLAEALPPEGRTADQQALADALGTEGLTDATLTLLRKLLEGEMGRAPAARLLSMLPSFRAGAQNRPDGRMDARLRDVSA